MDKYHMFTQFMYNELGITKEDIKQWVHDTVYEVAEKYVENEFRLRSLDSRIDEVLRGKFESRLSSGKSQLGYSLTQELGKELAKHFEVRLIDTEKE